MAEPLEAVIGYRFKNPDLLKQALSHKSFASESGSGAYNERLEFLGDSVLAAVVAHELYAEYPGEPEGGLSKKKSQLVSRPSLAAWGEELGLGARLYLGVGEETTGGRTRQSLLANAVEALIGAMYLDGGYDAGGEVRAEWCAQKPRRPAGDGPQEPPPGTAAEEAQDAADLRASSSAEARTTTRRSRSWSASARANSAGATARTRRKPEQAAARDALSRMKARGGLTMDYELTETQKEISDLAYQVAVRDIKPVREKHDAEGTFPWDVVKKMAAADLYGVYLPEAYGGLGGGLMEQVLVVEQLSRVCGGIALVLRGDRPRRAADHAPRHGRAAREVHPRPRLRQEARGVLDHRAERRLRRDRDEEQRPSSTESITF